MERLELERDGGGGTTGAVVGSGNSGNKIPAVEKNGASQQEETQMPSSERRTLPEGGSSNDFWFKNLGKQGCSLDFDGQIFGVTCEE